MKTYFEKYKLFLLLPVFLIIISISIYSNQNKENISITISGEEINVSTFTKTVRDLLDENKIIYDENDKIHPGLESTLKDNMDIEIIVVEKYTQKEYEKLPYETKIVEDKNLLKGINKVEQSGMSGKKETVYELVYEDGVIKEKNMISQCVIDTPIDKVIKKGIKQEVIVASRGESSRGGVQAPANLENGTHVKAVATAYYGHGITATGTKPKWGTIAVDPRVIPYGTKVYIPQFNMIFTAEDCGGAIKGNKIDIFMGSRSEAYSWGRRTIDIYILN